MKERHNTSGIRPQPLAKPKPPPSNVFRTLSGTKCTPGVSRQSAVPCPASRAAAAAASPDRHDFPHSPQLQPDDAEEQQWDAGHSGGAAPAEAPAAAAAPTSTGHFARCTTAGPAAADADKPEHSKTWRQARVIGTPSLIAVSPCSKAPRSNRHSCGRTTVCSYSNRSRVLLLKGGAVVRHARVRLQASAPCRSPCHRHRYMLHRSGACGGVHQVRTAQL